MIRLVLLRHGESTWNKENRSPVDRRGPDDKGREEAARPAGSEGAGFQFDVAYTSVLTRAIRTLWLALDEMDACGFPCTLVAPERTALRRAAGPEQGGDRRQARRGQVKIWRRSYDIRRRRSTPATRGTRRTTAATPRCARDIPLTESLKDTVARFLPHWHE
jgi:2,3-bisphosphoglycerate-dependent phosphoglycerate mutase